MSTSLTRFIETKAFQHFIVAVIVLAGVVAGLETSPAIMAQHEALLHGLDKFILGAFVIEAALKMAAHGRQPWRYFADRWNSFDFLVIVKALSIARFGGTVLLVGIGLLVLPGPGLPIIVVAATLAAFRRVSRAAAWLPAPYLAWVSFAAALDRTLYRLNT